MNQLFKKYCLIILSASISACVEPFTPEVSNYENLLVVEAFLSDDARNQEIILSRSYPIDTTRVHYETGAGVWLEYASGNQIVFRETKPGHFTPGAGFRPETGTSYTLVIATANGNLYKSDPVTMKKTPPVTGVYFERETITSNKTGGLDEGFQVYLDSETESNEPGYFKYEWEEIWEFSTPFYSFLDYNYDGNYAFIREENISRCWQGSFSTDLNLATTENITSGIIERQPIRFLSFRESILRVKYSILVKQFSLSEDGYRFWRNLKESNESTGSLYDAQPFQVTGNIKNVNNPSEPVLGYFDMATVSSKRIFIKRLADLPLDIKIPTLYPKCRIGADTVISYWELEKFLNIGYLISTYSTPPGSGFVMVVRSCIDCRLKGSNVKPEFWD